MTKLYIAFHDHGMVRDIATEALDAGYLPAPAKATSRLALRYRLDDGKVVDAYPGKTDDEVLALIAEQQAAQAQQAAPATPVTPERTLTKLAFMNRFTLDELAAIYAAAKEHVLIEVYLDKLKLASEIHLDDPQTQQGLQALVAASLLAESRVAEIVA